MSDDARRLTDAAVAALAATAGVSERAAARNLLALICERTLAQHVRPDDLLATASVSLRIGDGLVTIHGRPPARPRPRLFRR